MSRLGGGRDGDLDLVSDPVELDKVRVRERDKVRAEDRKDPNSEIEPREMDLLSIERDKR